MDYIVKEKNKLKTGFCICDDYTRRRKLAAVSCDIPCKGFEIYTYLRPLQLKKIKTYLPNILIFFSSEI